MLNALVAQAECRAGLRSGGHIVFHTFFQRRYRNASAKRRHRVRNRYIQIQVESLALKLLVILDADRYIQVAIRAASVACIAKAAQAECLTVVDSGRNFDLFLDVLANPTISVAIRTRVFDYLAGPAACRAGSRRRKRAENCVLLCPNLSRAVTRFACFRLCSRFCSRPAAG